MVFRLRQKSEEISAQVEELVLKAERIADQVVHGAHARKKSGSGEAFWQFREYTQDDDVRHIDWRQSAKTDRIFIKQKEEENAQKALFWSCGAESMAYASDDEAMEKGEAARILSLVLGLLAVRGGDQVGDFESGKTGHSQAAVTRLAHDLLRDNDTALPNVTSALPRHAHVFLCGDFLAPLEKIAERFERIGARTRQGIVVQILDPAEIEFPFSGRIEFREHDADETIQIDHAASVREAYLSRFEAHCERVRTLCEKLGWSYILHRTDEDLVQTVRSIVGAL